MQLIMKKLDILTIDRTKCAVAHCISGDFSLGAGLAKKINEQFDMSQKLMDKYTFTPGDRTALYIDGFFNLVTKDYYKDKATYDGLKACLTDLKKNMYYMGINKLAIPRLGCGKDKLDWNVVKALIEECFDGMDIDIYVCVL